MDIIIATASENCLVMVMLGFDVPYQRGALDVKSNCSWGDWIVHAAFSGCNLYSSSCQFCLWMWKVPLDLRCRVFCDVYRSVCAYVSVYVIASCSWLCGVYGFVTESTSLLLKVWLRHSHSLHHRSAFVVFICLPSDTDSIPPPSASVAPLPKCLAEGETVSRLCSKWSKAQLKMHNIS